jgi:uncharacterized protein (TIGR02246 family)
LTSRAARPNLQALRPKARPAIFPFAEELVFEFRVVSWPALAAFWDAPLRRPVECIAWHSLGLIIEFQAVRLNDSLSFAACDQTLGGTHMKTTLISIAAILAVMGLAVLAQNQPPGKSAPDAKSADAKSAPQNTVDTSPANADPDTRRADEAAIRASGAAFIAAYNARDAKKLTELWSPEAIYIDPASGDQINGREEIEKTFAEAFSDNQEAKIVVEDATIDFVSPNVAIVRGTARVISPGAEPQESEFTSVRVKRDGKWLIDRVSEVERQAAPPSNYEHLKDLAWMIGSWHDDDPRASVEIQTDCEWTKNRNFITRAFAVAIGDQVRRSGIQIIGWDPNEKQIRSWVFDSDGGFGEGFWTRKGNKWFIQNSGTLTDGGKASSVNIMTQLDNDSYKWESVNRDIDGELQPNVDPVVVVRKSDN